MRRFASVFVSKRDPPVQENTNQIFSSPRSPSSTFSTPPLSTASDPPHSSASSSGSTTASIQTPDDEAHPVFPSTAVKSSWKSWIGGKRLSYSRHADRKGKERNRDLPQWEPSITPSLQLPPLGNRATKRVVAADESLIPSASDSISFPDQVPVIHRTPPSPPLARKNLVVLTKNSLAPPLPISPFVQHSLGPIYPRSSNQPRVLPRRLPMIAVMMKKRLLTRLEDSSFILPSSEESFLHFFNSRPTSSEVSFQKTLTFDTSYPERTTRIFRSSPGLRRWISRPCFEDRYVVFAPEGNDVKCRTISGSSLAIAALEYSEYLDVLVDPEFDQTPQQETHLDAPWSSPAELSPSASVSEPPLLTAPTHTRNSYTATPSPLRNEHNSLVATKEFIPSEETVQPKRNTPSISASTVKRVVRFVEDDSDDGIPLHIVRMKKKQEGKAKFLRREQLKRAREEGEEKRRLEEEALERDRLRVAKEREKRERERRLFAEEVAATRMRREFQRAGGLSSQSNSSSSLLVPSPSSTSIKDSERNRPRDSRSYSSNDAHPRRDASDPGFITISTSRNHNMYDSSSGSSQPHSPASLSGHKPRSRPPSTYSAHTQSSSDEARHSGGSRRNSVVAAAPGSSSRAYQTWSGSSQSLHHIPPVPQVPDYVNDMPLLPPAAPFMKHSYSRQPASPGASDSSKSRRGTSNSSTQRASQLPRRQSASSAQSDHSPHRSSQSKRGESRPPDTPSGHNISGRPQPTPSFSYPQLPSGPQYVQPPNPWTALPSRTGQLPTMMPMSPLTHVGFQGMSQGRGNGMVDAHGRRHTLIS